MCPAPVYLVHVKGMSQVYAIAGDGAEATAAATRKFGIKSLWKSSGRSSEVSWCTWDGMQWDAKSVQMHLRKGFDLIVSLL